MTNFHFFSFIENYCRLAKLPIDSNSAASIRFNYFVKVSYKNRFFFIHNTYIICACCVEAECVWWMLLNEIEDEAISFSDYYLILTWKFIRNGMKMRDHIPINMLSKTQSLICNLHTFYICKQIKLPFVSRNIWIGTIICKFY